jgi:glutamate racemase
MYILTDIATGGVYAVVSNGDEKTVHMFEEHDDALRYVDHLRATDYTDELEILEVDPEVVVLNCTNYGYKYSVVSKDDLIIPPSQ